VLRRGKDRTQTVNSISLVDTRHPGQEWMDQIGRSATQETWGYLHPCRYVLHDRDPKFCASFRSALASGGVKTIQLPAKSPNLKAFAERWVRSVEQECLSKLILFGQGSLARVLVLTEYRRHYHDERNHQGKGNRLLFPRETDRTYRPSRNIACRQRLGGLLKHCQRAAWVFLPNGIELRPTTRQSEDWNRRSLSKPIRRPGVFGGMHSRVPSITYGGGRRIQLALILQI